MTADRPRAIVLAIGGSICGADVPALWERVELLAERSEAGGVICDVAALEGCDVDTVDALARLQLTARRLGSKIWLHRASAELQELLAFAGLAEVVPVLLPLEPGRQTEEREECVCIEEKGELDDPAA